MNSYSSPNTRQPRINNLATTTTKTGIANELPSHHLHKLRCRNEFHQRSPPPQSAQRNHLCPNKPQLATDSWALPPQALQQPPASPKLKPNPPKTHNKPSPPLSNRPKSPTTNLSRALQNLPNTPNHMYQIRLHSPEHRSRRNSHQTGLKLHLLCREKCTDHHN